MADEQDVVEKAVDPHEVHIMHNKAKVVLDKEIFCAACQAKTIQKMSRDKNHELVATCDCGRTLKIPMFDDPAELDAHLDDHHKNNVGQVSAELAEAEAAAADDRFMKLMGVAK